MESEKKQHLKDTTKNHHLNVIVRHATLESGSLQLAYHASFGEIMHFGQMFIIYPKNVFLKKWNQLVTLLCYQ